MIRYDVGPMPGYPAEIGTLLSALEDGTRHWRQELGDVSAEEIVWQPFPGGHSIGALLLHIADVEAYWIETVIAGRELSAEEQAELLSEVTDQYAVNWPVPPLEPFSYYVGILRRVRARTVETLKGFQDPADLRAGRNEYTVRWIVAHVLHHESYHAGQAVFLKLLRERASLSES